MQDSTRRAAAQFVRWFGALAYGRRDWIVVFACAVVVCGAASAQTFEPDVNRWGLDYRAIDLPAPDSRLCQKACVDELACLAWTHDREVKNGKCWLKYAVPAAAANKCCTSGVVRSAAGMKVAHTREAFEKRGLIGTFSTDCSKPVSPTHHYHVFRRLDGERVQSDTMTGPAERAEVWVGEAATEPAPNQLTIHAAQDKQRMTHTILLEGKRWRTLQTSWDNGRKTVVDGRWEGKETPWYGKCE